MPNHIHGIIELDTSTKIIRRNGESMYYSSEHKHGVNISYMPWRNLFPKTRGKNSKTIGSIVRGFKIGVTKYARMNMGILNCWQRSYHCHIIRNSREYQMISKYIQTNPQTWESDRYHPQSLAKKPIPSDTRDTFF